MLPWRARRRRPDVPDPDLLAELDNVLDEEIALRQELRISDLTGRPVARWTEQAVAPASVSREPGRRSYVVAAAWLLGVIVLAGAVWPSDAHDNTPPTAAGPSSPRDAQTVAPSPPGRDDQDDRSSAPADSVPDAQTSAQSGGHEPTVAPPSDESAASTGGMDGDRSAPGDEQNADGGHDHVWTPDPDLPVGTVVELGDCTVTVTTDGLALTGECPGLTLPSDLDDLLGRPGPDA